LITWKFDHSGYHNSVIPQSVTVNDEMHIKMNGKEHRGIFMIKPEISMSREDQNLPAKHQRH